MRAADSNGGSQPRHGQTTASSHARGLIAGTGRPLRLKSRRSSRGRERNDGGQRAEISHHFLTDWLDDTGLRRQYWTPGETMTCVYGSRRTGWTHRIDLRNRWKRLFVSYYCCWAELDSRADLDVRIRYLLASSQSLVQSSVNERDKKGKVSRMRRMAVGFGGRSAASLAATYSALVGYVELSGGSG